MRIVHVIEGLHPDRGGPPVVCAALAAAQARLGHEAWIVCEEPGSPRAESAALLAAQRGGDRVSIERVPAQGLYGALHGELRSATRAFAAQVDLVQIHGVWNPIAMAGARAARRRNAPYVLSTHGALHPSCLVDRSARKRAALAIGWRRLLRDARRVLCLNDEETRETDRLARRAVATTMPNGVDLEAIAGQRRGAFREARGGRPYFVFVGRLDRVKGLDLLLDAFGAFRRRGGRADLVLVGPDWGERAELERRAEALGCADAVRFEGPLYDARKYEALADAIAFVHRPRYEGFGLAVVESLAVGTPAIIGERCLLPTSGEAEGVVLEGGDDGAFAAAMRRLEDDSALRDRLGAAGIACVERRFSWDVIAAATLAAGGVGAEE